MSRQWPSPWPERPARFSGMISGPPAPRKGEGGPLNREIVGASDRSVELVGGADTVRVVVDERALEPMRVQTFAGTREHRAFLDLDDIEAEHNPGVIYGIYLQLPDGPSESDLSTHHIGNVSLFGVERARTPVGDEHAHSLHLSIDITEMLDELAESRKWSDGRQLNVTFRPITLTVPADTDVEDTCAAGHEDDPVRVGRVSIHYA